MSSEAIADLKRPWKNRVREDRNVTGALELAYLRGRHAGRCDMRDEIIRVMRKWFFTNADVRDCVKEIRALPDQ
jgi:hypothetical protein